MIIGVLALAIAAPVQAPDLNLTCPGATLVRNGSAVTVQDNAGYSVNGVATSSGMQSVSFTVRVRIKGGVAQVNIPPSVTGGASGKAGWFNVKNLLVSDDEISGLVRIGLLSSSRFAIDRRSGIISTDGGFSGQCRKDDEAARAF